ncbi:guanine nucleotide-binding protein subunit alpha [Clydaea vesicula]|uniref:Guanine nucleotide-binding protein subunit alpha n=1 Tax=Clydaea vesicula TaxID=447962 RepID=A0AAD5TTF0_9FUNG|nr:guanine nucleotide-binding protein subunit alpha [Clydaea vesicula]KAJ3386435.1 guanine nucleotide-binding protein subunit alpha [Lobulomyces angularis]
MYMDDIDVNATTLEDTDGIVLTQTLPLTPRKAKQRSTSINKQLKLDKKELYGKEIRKILILGSADSGKSTIIRQIRLSNSAAFTGEEKDFFKKIIWENICCSTKALVIGAEKLGIGIKSWDFLNDAILIKEYQFEKKKDLVEEEICTAIKRLWKDESLKECYRRRIEIPEALIQDTSIHFFNDLERIFDKKYAPTDQDIILCRKATFNITETTISSTSGLLKFYDVGGQKHLRSFWVPYFEDSHAILFVAALSSFNQVMQEEDSLNRMVDSLELFKSISNNTLLVKCPIILFLNKIDLLLEKIKIVKVQDFFPEFKDPQSEKAVVNFFTKKFKDSTPRELNYIHYTTGTDSKLMAKINRNVL